MSEHEPQFVPGARVTLIGLKSNASINGRCAVVQPKEEWPPHESRIAVRLEGGDSENMRIAVKPQNLVLATEEATSACCFICLEEATGPTAAPLLQTGCGCRGTAGHVHALCAMRAAAAEHERAGTWAGKHPWQLCATCKLPFTGALKLALAQEWCRRTEPLPPTDVQRSPPGPMHTLARTFARFCFHVSRFALIVLLARVPSVSIPPGPSPSPLALPLPAPLLRAHSPGRPPGPTPPPPLATVQVQRFAARTTLSNALSAAGRLAEAGTSLQP